MLYSDSAGCFLLGCLCNEPSLLRSGKYPLTPNDFEPNLFHKYLFALINNLAFQGLEDITEIEIDQFMQSYPNIKEKIEDEDGLEFVRIVKQQAISGNVDLYYQVIRKFALLRKAKELGIDITKIYDESQDTESQLQNLNSMSIDQMLNTFDGKVVELKKEFAPTSIREEMWAGVDFDQVLKQFESTPAMGAGLCSPYETSIFRGWQTGHLLLRSGGSGSGKTTTAIGDLCHVGCKELWDEKEQDFVPNLNYRGGGFFIHTEMDQKLELQPKFISFISNIPLHKILDGKYTEVERKRLLKAADILVESRIKLIDMPQFTIPLLRNTIKEMAITEDLQYGVFDYVQDNGIAGKVYKNEVGTAIRQDMLLLAIVSDLKACAEEFGVGILSMTQLNGQEKVLPVIDEHCLFGSKSMKNKVDGGAILVPPTKKELEHTKVLRDKRGFGDECPNMVSHIYKGRFSKYGQNLKVFQKIDYGTGRIEDCYVTNIHNAPVHVDKTYVEVEDENISRPDAERL